jgi:drug/metabolite transporter (DMT)-like permease
MSSPELALGVLCAIGAAACFDGAVAWQAMEARQVAQDDRRLLLRLARRPRWLLATGLAALGWPLQLAALSLAPVTVVQPALATGLVVLLVMGRLVLHEPVGGVEIASAGAIITGVAVLAWAAPDRATATAGTLALALAVGVPGAIAALPLIVKSSGRLSTVAAGCAFACTGLTSKLVSDALASGDIAAIAGWGLATGAVVLLGVNDDMAALQRLPATRVAPAILAIEVVLPVALAPLAFHESWSGTPGGGLAILAGLAIVTAGVIPLASARAVSAVERPDP